MRPRVRLRVGLRVRVCRPGLPWARTRATSIRSTPLTSSSWREMLTASSETWAGVVWSGVGPAAFAPRWLPPLLASTLVRYESVVEHLEIWGDMGRYGEIWGEARCEGVVEHMRRSCGLEIWGDT